MASGLTSASTLTEVESAYDNNATYAEDRSVAKCRDFVTACRMLIRRLPTVQVKGANSLSFNLENLRKELEDAQAWLLEHTTPAADIQADPRAIRADFRNSRS